MASQMDSFKSGSRCFNKTMCTNVSFTFLQLQHTLRVNCTRGLSEITGFYINCCGRLEIFFSLQAPSILTISTLRQIKPQNPPNNFVPLTIGLHEYVYTVNIQSIAVPGVYQQCSAGVFRKQKQLVQWGKFYKREQWSD